MQNAEQGKINSNAQFRYREDYGHLTLFTHKGSVVICNLLPANDQSRHKGKIMLPHQSLEIKVVLLTLINEI